MFVEAHTTLPMSSERACAAVERALADHALTERSEQAVHAGMDLMLAVGPSRLPRQLTKTVQARTLDTRQIGRTSVIPIRWEATGVTAGLYPTLDANIGITPSDEQTTVLSIIGSYTPPLGGFGAGLDRVAMSRVAQGTVEAFLQDLASAATATPAHAPST